MRKLTRSSSVVAAGIAVTMVAGVAYAAWTSSGSGSGSAKSLQTVESSIAAVTPTADLYPGGTGSMTVKITNNNPYPATVTAISAGSSDVNGACVAGSVTSDADNAPTGSVLAAGAFANYTVVTHMLATATNACRNVTFTLPLTATLTTGS
jgi:hypothetical protein